MTEFSLAPLAERLRPQTLDDIIGQPELLNPGRPLRQALQHGDAHSMIFWGPPGVGKTTLARLSAQALGHDFITLSAVLARSEDLRSAIARARENRQQGRRTLLFVDEIHRFNARQQDTLLPEVAGGQIILLGTTTENPSFALIGALLRLTRVYVLRPLDASALRQLLQRARRLALGHLHFDAPAIDALVGHADGDARRLLNLLEHCNRSAAAAGIERLDAGFVAQTLSHGARRFDKGGDQFYDQISALHKSVRGSNPDAALYWLCRMLDGGVQLRYLARRILCMAWDDIGLADPRGVELARQAAECCERFEREDAALALAQAVLYLSIAAKSNAGGVALMQARAFVRQDGPRPVPQCLRPWADALTPSDATGEGGFMPAGAPQRPGWYQPVPRGLELRIAGWMRGREAG